MLWQKIKIGFGKVVDFGKELFSKIYSEATGETKNVQFRFYFISTSVALLFFIVYVLVGKNPFALLIPFSLYDLPRVDKKSEVTLFISDGKNNILKSKRKILLPDNDALKKMYTIVGELSQSPYNDDIENTGESVFPKKLPDLKSSIIVAWFLDSEKRLILDLNEAAIQSELSNIRVKVDQSSDSIFEKHSKEEELVEQKRIEELQKARVQILNTALGALEKTLFLNFPNLEGLEFRLNGKIKTFDGLEYNLAEVKKRN